MKVQGISWGTSASHYLPKDLQRCSRIFKGFHGDFPELLDFLKDLQGFRWEFKEASRKSLKSMTS